MAIVISGNGIDMGGNPVSNASKIDSTVINENGESVATKVGTVITFANSSVPTGFLECNGAKLSRTAYADLFAVIGTIYGAGDGSTTFALPDLRGEFIRGFDNGRGVDVGRTIGSYQADELKSHSHSSNTNVVAYAEGRSSYAFGYAVNGGSTGTTGGNETRPRNIAMMYCIKY